MNLSYKWIDNWFIYVFKDTLTLREEIDLQQECIIFSNKG